MVKWVKGEREVSRAYFNRIALALSPFPLFPFTHFPLAYDWLWLNLTALYPPAR